MDYKKEWDELFAGGWPLLSLKDYTWAKAALLLFILAFVLLFAGERFLSFFAALGCVISFLQYKKWKAKIEKAIKT